jgi:hypothetical protein
VPLDIPVEKPRDLRYLFGNEEADKLARQASVMPLPGPEPALGIPKRLSGPGLWTNTSMPWGIYQATRDGKLVIGRPCKKRADDLPKLSRHQLKMVVAILAGHAAVRKHLRSMGLFEGDPTCRFCMKEAETVQHIICRCEALARQCYNIFGLPFVKPKVISTASVRNLCLFIRGTELLNSWWM